MLRTSYLSPIHFLSTLKNNSTVHFLYIQTRHRAGNSSARLEKAGHGNNMTTKFSGPRPRYRLREDVQVAAWEWLLTGNDNGEKKRVKNTNRMFSVTFIFPAYSF